MRDYTLAHLRDEILLRDLAALVAHDRVTTAALLAHIAEVDVRGLYAPAGYASMHAYCVEELRLSEDAAYKRIQAARAARRFPALFAALADSRLHLSAVCLLAPQLSAENVGELIEAATHRRKSEIEEVLARRFPRPEVPARVRAIPAIPAGFTPRLAPGQVGSEAPHGIGTTDHPLALGQVEGERAKSAPASPERFLLEVTIGTSTRDKLRYAQALLSHAVPTGDVAQVLDRALDALIRLHEKRKFGAIPRRPRRPCSTVRKRYVRKRYVPAHVRRAVWERDQGRCTFVGAAGHRCTARRLLEFDHVDPMARGGKATVEGMRLLCRTHNQYEAQRMFGAGFMSGKRHRARLAAAEARARASAKEQTQDVVAGLRSLGCRADQARRAAEFSETLHGASLEERMRASLKFLCGRSVPGPAPPEGSHVRNQGADGQTLTPSRTR